MRFITPRYPNKSIIVGENIFPVDTGLVNDGKMKIQNQLLASSAVINPEKPKDESFWTTPTGAVLSLGLVFGGLYYLGKNMGVTHER